MIPDSSGFLQGKDEDHSVVSIVQVPIFNGQEIDLPVCGKGKGLTTAIWNDLAGDLSSDSPRLRPLVADEGVDDPFARNGRGYIFDKRLC